jgi:hypothetical protein
VVLPRKSSERQRAECGDSFSAAPFRTPSPRRASGDLAARLSSTFLCPKFFNFDSLQSARRIG